MNTCSVQRWHHSDNEFGLSSFRLPVIRSIQKARIERIRRLLLLERTGSTPDTSYSGTIQLTGTTAADEYSVHFNYTGYGDWGASFDNLNVSTSVPANNDCHANATCTDLDPKTDGGTYSCACNTGYSGNGTLRTQVACPADAEDFNCTCLSGMSGSCDSGPALLGRAAAVTSTSAAPAAPTTVVCQRHVHQSKTLPPTVRLIPVPVMKVTRATVPRAAILMNVPLVPTQGANSACTDKDLANDGVKFCVVVCLVTKATRSQVVRTSTIA